MRFGITASGITVGGFWLIFCWLIFGPALAVAAETSKIPAGMALRGTFEHQRHLDGFDNPLVSKGFFVLAPKKVLLWQTEQPVKSRIIIADGVVRQFVDGKKTFARPISEAGGLAVLAGLLNAALSGDWAALQKNFNVEQKQQGANWHSIYHGDKDDENTKIERIEFLGRRFVDAVNIFHTGGNRDEIRFSEQTTIPLAQALRQNRLE
jgi:hypothetical protein